MTDWWPLAQAFLDAVAFCTFLWAYYLVYRWWMR